VGFGLMGRWKKKNWRLCRTKRWIHQTQKVTPSSPVTGLPDKTPRKRLYQSITENGGYSPGKGGATILSRPSPAIEKRQSYNLEKKGEVLISDTDRGEKRRSDCQNSHC